MSGNEAPQWVDDGTLGWSPERELAFTPPPAAPRLGPWSPPESTELTEAESEESADLLWPWRLGLGLAQGFLFFLLFRSRAEGGWPGGDAFLFDAIALPALFVPWVLMAGLGRVPLPRLLAFAAIAAAILAMLGWYHRWRILGVAPGQPGLSMLVLAALALFIAQSFLHAAKDGRRIAPADFFTASWSLAARFSMLLLALGLGFALAVSLPRLSLERGDLLAMPALGLIGALAFQLTTLSRFTAALTNAMLATATILLPLAVATAIIVLSTSLAEGPPRLIWLLALMSGLAVAIAASYRDGGKRPAWREGFEVFGALLLAVLGALAVWALQSRVAALGWTAPRLFAAAWTVLLCACGLGYAVAALAGLVRGQIMKGLGAVNMALAAATLLGTLALASPLADPLRLAPAAQAARLEQGRVTIARFDFANLPRDGARFGNDALTTLSRSLYPDIAHAAQTAGGRLLTVGPGETPNPTEIGANIATRTPGARLPATLLARDWSGVAGVPPCLSRAAERCEAFFLDLNNDQRQEILLVTGGESRWWGAVMEEDAAGRWRMAGRLAAGCGATLADLRAGRFAVLSALPGWNDLAVAGTRLSVTPSGTGCSHY